MDDALRKLVQSVHVIRGMHRAAGGRDAIPVGDPQRKHRSIGGGSFAGKKNPDAKTLARVANKFIYHSGTIDDVDNMKWGLEPQHGDWIRELANHAGDIEPEELLQQSTPLVWMSDKPSWVAMKVARKLKKHSNDVTDDEISQHGHVAMVPRKGEHAEHIWHVGEKGLDNGEYSPVTNLKGETKKAGWTDLYQNDWSGNKSPFGVEKNEYVSAQPVEPMFHLTGQDLVDFLHHTGTRKSATGNNGNFDPSNPDITKTEGGDVEDYRGGHQAPRRSDDVAAPLHDTTGVYPADLYGPNGLHYYGDKTDPIDQESYRHTVRLKGRPEAPVKIYRAIPHEPSAQEKLVKLESDMAAYQKRRKLPKDAGTTNGSQWYDNAYDLREKLRTQPNEVSSSIATINPGDWVTPSRAYAKMHGDSVLRGKYKILSKTVKAKDVFTNGDSLNEWGYDPEVKKAAGGTATWHDKLRDHLEEHPAKAIHGIHVGSNVRFTGAL